MGKIPMDACKVCGDASNDAQRALRCLMEHAYLCEPSWVVLPEGHEEHPQDGVAIMGAECRIVHVMQRYGDETDADMRALAEALCRLLNANTEIVEMEEAERQTFITLKLGLKAEGERADYHASLIDADRAALESLRAQLAAKDAEIARLRQERDAANDNPEANWGAMLDGYHERALDAESAVLAVADALGLKPHEGRSRTGSEWAEAIRAAQATRSTALTAAYQCCEDRADLYRLAAEQTASAVCARDLFEQARGARACAAAIRALMEKPHA